MSQFFCPFLFERIPAYQEEDLQCSYSYRRTGTTRLTDATTRERIKLALKGTQYPIGKEAPSCFCDCPTALSVERSHLYQNPKHFAEWLEGKGWLLIDTALSRTGLVYEMVTTSHFSVFRERQFLAAKLSTADIIFSSVSILEHTMQMSLAWAKPPPYKPEKEGPKPSCWRVQRRGSITIKKRLGERTDPYIMRLCRLNTLNSSPLILSTRTSMPFLQYPSRRIFLAEWDIALYQMLVET